MFRRMLFGGIAVLLSGIIIVFLIVRQLVFGGTPTIHRNATQPTLAVSPCATIGSASGLRAFRIVTQQSNASYEAHFLVAGHSVPGTVTGVTGDVSGEFLLSSDQQSTIRSLKIVVDLRHLDSGAPDRDAHVSNDTLEVSKYPNAFFSVTNAQVLSGSYTEGQTVTFQLRGNLTLHGVTRPTAFAIQAWLSGEKMAGSATTLIHLQDFNMVPPMTTSVVPITVSRDITLTVRFTGQRTNCTHLT